MEKDRLVLPRRKRRRNNEDSRGSIRVRESTMEIIDEIAEESRLPKIEIIDRMIKFAQSQIEWEEVEY